MTDTAPSLWFDLRDDTYWLRVLGPALAAFLKVSWRDESLLNCVSSEQGS